MRHSVLRRRATVRSSFRALFAVAAVMGSLAACGDDGLIDPNPIAGAYTATTFRVTPAGQSEIDVLTQGGALVIAIGVDNTTAGTLNLPAVVTGDEALQASMAGTAELNGSGVQFDQTADTFVRDLNWAFTNNTISVTNQSVGGASFTIVLTR